jgi:hypothetical protein
VFTSRNERRVTPKALLTLSGAMRRRNTRMCGWPSKAPQEVRVRIPNVVVFTPPPVLPGDAPTNIKRTSANRVA